MSNVTADQETISIGCKITPIARAYLERGRELGHGPQWPQIMVNTNGNVAWWTYTHQPETFSPSYLVILT